MSVRARQSCLSHVTDSCVWVRARQSVLAQSRHRTRSQGQCIQPGRWRDRGQRSRTGKTPGCDDSSTSLIFFRGGRGCCGQGAGVCKRMDSGTECDRLCCCGGMAAALPFQPSICVRNSHTDARAHTCVSTRALQQLHTRAAAAQTMCLPLHVPACCSNSLTCPSSPTSCAQCVCTLPQCIEWRRSIQAPPPALARTAAEGGPWRKSGEK